MPTTEIDVQDLPIRLAEVLSLAASGTEVIVTEASVPRARLIPLPPIGAPRVPGLHPGALKETADFDAPLADEFWSGQP